MTRLVMTRPVMTRLVMTRLVMTSHDQTSHDQTRHDQTSHDKTRLFAGRTMLSHRRTSVGALASVAANGGGGRGPGGGPEVAYMVRARPSEVTGVVGPVHMRIQVHSGFILVLLGVHGYGCPYTPVPVHPCQEAGRTIHAGLETALLGLG